MRVQLEATEEAVAWAKQRDEEEEEENQTKNDGGDSAKKSKPRYKSVMEALSLCTLKSQR